MAAKAEKAGKNRPAGKKTVREMNWKKVFGDGSKAGLRKTLLLLRREDSEKIFCPNSPARAEVTPKVNKSDFATFSMLMSVIIAVQVHWLLALVFFLGTYAFLAES